MVFASTVRVGVPHDALAALHGVRQQGTTTVRCRLSERSTRKKQVDGMKKLTGPETTEKQQSEQTHHGQKTMRSRYPIRAVQ